MHSVEFCFLLGCCDWLLHLHYITHYFSQYLYSKLPLFQCLVIVFPAHLFPPVFPWLVSCFFISLSVVCFGNLSFYFSNLPVNPYRVLSTRHHPWRKAAVAARKSLRMEDELHMLKNLWLNIFDRSKIIVIIFVTLALNVGSKIQDGRDYFCEIWKTQCINKCANFHNHLRQFSFPLLNNVRDWVTFWVDSQHYMLLFSMIIKEPDTHAHYVTFISAKHFRCASQAHIHTPVTIRANWG